MKEKRINLRFSPEEYKAFDDMRQKEGTKFQELGARFFRAWLEGQDMPGIKKFGLEIPTDLHQRVEAAAAGRGVKIKEATEQAFESWLKTGDGTTQIVKPDKNIVQTSVRFQKDLHDDLRMAAAQLDVSIDAFIKEAVRDKIAGIPVSHPKTYEKLLENVYKLNESCDNIRSAVDALRKGVTAADERYRERSPTQAVEDELDRTLRELQPVEDKGSDDTNQGYRAPGDPEYGDREGAVAPKPIGERHNPPHERRRGT